MSTKLFVKKPVIVGQASIKTQPTKTSYVADEKFNPKGMEILIHYTSGSNDVTISDFEYDVNTTPTLSVSDTSAVINIVYEGINGREIYSVTQPITVSSAITHTNNVPLSINVHKN